MRKTVLLAVLIAAIACAVLLCVRTTYMDTSQPATQTGFKSVTLMLSVESGPGLEYLSDFYDTTATFALSAEAAEEALASFERAIVEQKFAAQVHAYHIQVLGLKAGDRKSVYAHAWCRDLSADPRTDFITLGVMDGGECYLDMVLEQDGTVTIDPHGQA